MNEILYNANVNGCEIEFTKKDLNHFFKCCKMHYTLKNDKIILEYKDKVFVTHTINEFFEAIVATLRKNPQLLSTEIENFEGLLDDFFIVQKELLFNFKIWENELLELKLIDGKILNSNSEYVNFDECTIFKNSMWLKNIDNDIVDNCETITITTDDYVITFKDISMDVSGDIILLKYNEYEILNKEELDKRKQDKINTLCDNIDKKNKENIFNMFI